LRVPHVILLLHSLSLPPLSPPPHLPCGPLHSLSPLPPPPNTLAEQGTEMAPPPPYPPLLPTPQLAAESRGGDPPVYPPPSSSPFVGGPRLDPVARRRRAGRGAALWRGGGPFSLPGPARSTSPTSARRRARSRGRRAGELNSPQPASLHLTTAGRALLAAADGRGIRRATSRCSPSSTQGREAVVGAREVDDEEEAPAAGVGVATAPSSSGPPPRLRRRHLQRPDRAAGESDRGGTSLRASPAGARQPFPAAATRWLRPLSRGGWGWREAARAHTCRSSRTTLALAFEWAN
jgi:hypothetical protein